MPRFFATLLSRADSDDPQHVPLYEETFLLVDAASLAAARVTAEEYGFEAEHDYDAVAGKHVFWRFVEVVDITPCIDENVDREVVELGGRFFRDKPGYDRLRAIDEEPQ